MASIYTELQIQNVTVNFTFFKLYVHWKSKFFSSISSFIEVFNSSTHIIKIQTPAWFEWQNVCIQGKSISWILTGWVASHCKIFQLQIKLVQLIHCYQEVKLKMYLILSRNNKHCNN